MNAAIVIILSGVCTLTLLMWVCHKRSCKRERKESNLLMQMTGRGHRKETKYKIISEGYGYQPVRDNTDVNNPPDADSGVPDKITNPCHHSKLDWDMNKEPVKHKEATLRTKTIDGLIHGMPGYRNPPPPPPEKNVITRTRLKQFIKKQREIGEHESALRMIKLYNKSAKEFFKGYDKIYVEKGNIKAGLNVKTNWYFRTNDMIKADLAESNKLLYDLCYLPSKLAEVDQTRAEKEQSRKMFETHVAIKTYRRVKGEYGK